MVNFVGAIYRILNRGDRREDIFCDEQDRKRFVEALSETCAKAGWQVHAGSWTSLNVKLHRWMKAYSNTRK